MIGATAQSSGSIAARLAQIAAAARADAPPARRFRQATAAIVTRDHAARLLAGVDADGRAFAPAAPSTIKRRGPGPVLVPRGMSSALIAGFRAEWADQGGAWTLVGKLTGSAVRWAGFHLAGGRRLPRRDFSGIGRAARGELAAAVHQLGAEVLDGR